MSGWVGQKKVLGSGGRVGRTCEASLAFFLGRVVLHAVGGLDNENVGLVLIRHFGGHEMPLWGSG